MCSRHLCLGSKDGNLSLMSILMVDDFMGLGHEFLKDIVLVTFSVAVVRHYDQDHL